LAVAEGVGDALGLALGLGDVVLSPPQATAYTARAMATASRTRDGVTVVGSP
jgi:hypothetical protein